MSTTRRSQQMQSQSMAVVTPSKKSPTRNAATLKESQNLNTQKIAMSNANTSTPQQQSSKENQHLTIGQQNYNLRSSQSGDKLKILAKNSQEKDFQKSENQANGGKKANKTLNLKGSSMQTKIIRTPVRRSLNTNLEEVKSNESPEIKCHFATERINLPRGKVVRSSRSSSAYGSKRGSQSPVKLPRNVLIQESEPTFQGGKVDYFKEYWRLYFQNESLVQDIEVTAHSNYKALKKIYNLEDYYEHNLIPQLLTYPHKFVHRLRQQQLQKQQQQQKLLMQQKQQQEMQQQQQQISKAKDELQSQEKQSQEQSINEQSSQAASSINGLNPIHNKDRQHKRKKHLRRTAAEIEREFIVNIYFHQQIYQCPYAECGKFYGSEGSLNLHIKIKHNGGNKTEREKLAKTLVQAYVNGSINRELESLDLNLPPGALQKAVKKAGLLQQVSESEILRQITQQIQQQQAAAVGSTSSSISGIFKMSSP